MKSPGRCLFPTGLDMLHLPLQVHSALFSNLLCVPGGWPVWTASIRNACLLASGCIQPVEGMSRRWKVGGKKSQAVYPPDSLLADFELNSGWIPLAKTITPANITYRNESSHPHCILLPLFRFFPQPRMHCVVPFRNSCQPSRVYHLFHILRTQSDPPTNNHFSLSPNRALCSSHFRIQGLSPSCQRGLNTYRD